MFCFIQIGKSLETQRSGDKHAMIWGEFLPCLQSVHSCASAEATVAIWMKFVGVPDANIAFEVAHVEVAVHAQGTGSATKILWVLLFRLQTNLSFLYTASIRHTNTWSFWPFQFSVFGYQWQTEGNIRPCAFRLVSLCYGSVRKSRARKFKALCGWNFHIWFNTCQWWSLWSISKCHCDWGLSLLWVVAENKQ